VSSDLTVLTEVNCYYYVWNKTRRSATANRKSMRLPILFINGNSPSILHRF